MSIGIIIGIVLFVCVIGAGIFAAASFDECETARGVVGVLLAVACGIAFVIVPFSFRTVKTGEIAVVRRYGKIVETKEAGIHYGFWMINKYEKYDTKVQNMDCETMAYSADAQTMNVQLTIQYQVMSDKVVDIATQYGSLEVLQNRINSVAIEKAKSVLSSYKAMDIIANRAQISPAVEAAIKAAVDEDYFVNIATVVLTNIDFSNAFELAVEEKMIAEQAKLKADYENDMKVAQAEAEAAAKLKEAQAEIEIAKAKAEALKIAAEAEAQANKTISESLTEDILNKILADAWDGRLPAVVGGGGEYILPSDIFGNAG